MQHEHMKFTFIQTLSTDAPTTQAKAGLTKKGRHEEEDRRGGHDLVKRKSTAYQGKFGGNIDLFKNVTARAALTIINAVGPDGITTRKLLDEIRSHDTYTLKEYLTEHKIRSDRKGERRTTCSWSIPPVYNIIRERGNQLLLCHQPFY
jgi:hypothetical protein